MDNVRVVRLLLEHGADVDVRGNSGKTPSELAWLPKLVTWARDSVRPNRDRWASVAFGMPNWDIWALVWT